MAGRIEDHALLGDTHTAALVTRDGTVDWLCAPRFDSDACFAALLGDEGHGHWSIAPRGPARAIRRRYRKGSLVLETELTTDTGVLRLTDCMPPRQGQATLVRAVEAVQGSIPVRLELLPRFGYGRSRPWVAASGTSGTAFSGPEALRLVGPVPLRAENGGLVAELELAEGQKAAFVLDWYRSFEQPPGAVDPLHEIEATTAWWRDWVASCRYQGPWREAVIRWLVTLKALTYAPSGGVVAAPTTSLPEQLGGSRNWDYRFCWLRDATFTLHALMRSGFRSEAEAWRDWLVRAAAGEPDAIQTLYGPGGERRLTETELPWLPGYHGSRPVRIGNRAARQFQLDVFGEVLDCLHQARRSSIHPAPEAWQLEEALVAHVEAVWRRPDHGIWEIRGEPRHFTHSKVMAWVALDRAVQDVRRFGLPGPAERWARVRDEIHADVCRQAWSARRGSFVQSYGSEELDASLLLIPLVGFLPASDARVRATVGAIERELCEDGLVRRYRASREIDGLPGREGVFLPCSFWLAVCQQRLGRTEDARRLFERLLSLCNDVGLLSEEYDPAAGRMIGNFPQALSHVMIVNTAHELGGGGSCSGPEPEPEPAQCVPGSR